MDKMILYEDSALFVVHKPSGIATQTARIGQADIVSELKNYQKRKGSGAYIGVVHRLDQPVEGLLVFAKTPQAAANLSRQLDSGSLKKSYVALVDGAVSGEAKLADYLLKDTRTNLSKVVGKETNGAKKAVLCYRGIQSCNSFSVVEIELFTGRHHQIRVQFSHAGYPLLGDMKYGTEHAKELSKQLGIENTALLANKLSFLHPDDGSEMNFEIDYKKIFKNIRNSRD